MLILTLYSSSFLIVIIFFLEVTEFDIFHQLGGPCSAHFFPHLFWAEWIFVLSDYGNDIEIVTIRKII